MAGTEPRVNRTMWGGSDFDSVVDSDDVGGSNDSDGEEVDGAGSTNDDVDDVGDDGDDVEVVDVGSATLGS